MKEFYKSDTVDALGNAHETVGENIRCKENVLAVLTGKSNVALTSEELSEIKTYLGIVTPPTVKTRSRKVSEDSKDSEK